MLPAFETNQGSLVSVAMDMNAKATRKVLKVEFKQFQRLPEWPPVKVNERRRRESDDRKDQVVPPPQGLADYGVAAQTLAE